MRIPVLLALISLLSTAEAPPPGTCGPWVSQSDGSKWRMCTDAQKHTYCELKRGSKITRFVCPD